MGSAAQEDDGKRPPQRHIAEASARNQPLFKCPCQRVPLTQADCDPGP